MGFFSVSPSSPWIFHSVSLLKIKKVLVPPMGNKDRNNKFCGTTLFAEKIRPLSTVPTHRLPHNAGTASKDTRKSVLSALGGPFAAPLFAPLSAPGTLCGCAYSFTSAS